LLEATVTEPSAAPVIELCHVTKTYHRSAVLTRLFDRTPPFLALDDVSLTVASGDIVGVVGESGSGKSTLANIAVGLAAPTSGEVLLNGIGLTVLARRPASEWRPRVQMVFQDSNGALNPRKTIGRCLTETLALRGVSSAARRDEAAALLILVGLGADLLDRLPHELSGGQRQRIGLARALAMKPRVLIADEPVSSLDVSLQAQIVNLLWRLTQELGLTLVFISHDLALVRSLCRRVVVMCNGRIVEQGLCADIFANPAEAYTRRLLDAVPRGLSRHRAAPATTPSPAST
jgi:ABC-type glutathione transport system ATPase component